MSEGVSRAEEEVYHWLALERVPGVGPMSMVRLVNALGSPGDALAANRRTLERIDGVGKRVVDALETHRPDPDEIYRDMETLKRLKARLLTLWDQDFPEALRQIHNPPALLFVRGEIRQADERAVAIIGMRNPSRYGLEMTEMISRGLVGANFTLVSGLARGIDTACHRAALKWNGRTIGVLGCGIDVAYPRENKALIEDIAREGGAVISEFRPGVQPHGTNFPGRNRIVSGLSKAVLVVESTDRSGALITVEHALDQNRDVFATPGNVLNIRSKGPHKLIKQGAGLVESADDIIEALDGARISNKEPPKAPEQTRMVFGISDEGNRVLEVLDADPTPMDTICRTLNMEAGPLAAALLELELAGRVRQSPGKMFSKVIK
jgi:DNA processing protein